MQIAVYNRCCSVFATYIFWLSYVFVSIILPLGGVMCDRYDPVFFLLLLSFIRTQKILRLMVQ